MSTTTQLVMTRLNVDDARCLALFASGLQPSDAPTAEAVAQARRLAVWPRPVCLGWNIRLIREKLAAVATI